VLVVEDEAQVRKMAQALLRRLGYEVVTAVDGIEALEVFRGHQERIGCVLLDLTMPRLDGWGTLAALRALRPDLPVILASGYSEAQAMEGAHAERPQVFLHKPYSMADLEAALEAVMPLKD
jgi:CheY-like chemotaxis protein